MKRVFVILACTAFLMACGCNKAQENKCSECKTECNSKHECDKQECGKECEKQECAADKKCADKECGKKCEKQECAADKKCADKECGKKCEKQECAADKKCAKQETGCIQLNSEDFKKLVADLSQPEWKYLGDKPAVVDFYADWCGPCKAISPILEEIAKEYAGELYIYKINVDNDPSIADAFNIQAIPTLLFIPMEGRYTVKTGGMPKEELVNIIKEKCLKL